MRTFVHLVNREQDNDPALKKIRELPGLNHMFQTAGTGPVSEYGKIEETIAPAALKTITEWILSETKTD